MTANSSPAESKSHLRRVARQKRDALSPEEHARLSERIVAHAFDWLREAASPGSTIAIYLATPREVSLDALLPRALSLGLRVAAPTQSGFALCEEGAASTCIQTRAWRLPQGEPVGVDEIALAFVPGLAFDAFGGRLGQGGGWYDRALSGSGCVRIGVAFEVQVLASTHVVAGEEEAFVGRVPCEQHDLRMDFLLSEIGLRARVEK